MAKIQAPKAYSSADTCTEWAVSGSSGPARTGPPELVTASQQWQGGYPEQNANRGRNLKASRGIITYVTENPLTHDYSLASGGKAGSDR